MLLVTAHRPARIASRRRHAPGFRQLEHLRQHAHRLVGLVGLVPHLVVQRRDMGPIHRRKRQRAQLRHDVGVQTPPEHVHRRRPAVHLQMRAYVALREIGNGRLRRRWRRKRLLPPSQPVYDLGRTAARHLQGGFDIRSEGRAPQAFAWNPRPGPDRTCARSRRPEFQNPPDRDPRRPCPRSRRTVCPPPVC